MFGSMFDLALSEAVLTMFSIRFMFNSLLVLRPVLCAGFSSRLSYPELPIWSLNISGLEVHHVDQLGYDLAQTCIGF